MSRSAPDPEAILQRLDWTVIRRLDGQLLGDYRTLFLGFGLDLAELREYELTDDVRYIDWNVTARMPVPYVRQFMEDREITAWFLLDMSPSVDFGTVRALKRNLLIDFVGVISRLLTRRGNRVGAILYTGEVEKVIPARGGRNQVLHLIDVLQKQPRLTRSPPTNLTSLLEAALGVLHRRSLVFIVSDFISSSGWDKALGVLTQRHETLAVRLSDPRESELPDIGPVVLEDAETGAQLYLDTHDSGFRRRFADSSRKRESELDRIFASSRVDLLSLSTETEMLGELVKFAMLRKRRKQMPAAASIGRAATSSAPPLRTPA